MTEIQIDDNSSKVRGDPKALVSSPMWTFSAYPTPKGGVLKAKSSTSAKMTVTATVPRDKQERPVSSVNFEPPFSVVCSSTVSVLVYMLP